MSLLGLLWRVDHALGRLSRRMLERHGVTSPQRVAIRTLLRAPDTTAAGVAALLRVDRSAVSGILGRLEDAGFVARAPHAHDGRKQHIAVTEAGRRMDALRHGTVEAAMERTLASMSAGEVDAVRRFLVAFEVELDQEREILGRPGEVG